MTTVHIKRVAKVTTGSTPPTNEPRFYETEEVDWFTPGDMDEQNIFCRAEKRIADTFFSETGCQKMPSGSVLMVGIGATVGKVGYSDHECYANQQINAISFNQHKVLPKYGAYWLLSKKEEINKITPTVTLPIFNQSKVKMLMISYPNVSVQQKIVDYLDEKTSAIDTQVELLDKKKDAYTRLKKAMINRTVTHGLDEHVKLKDSGVEWIGMIPEHWERFRLKDLGYMYSGLTGKSGDDFRCDDETKTKHYVPFTNVLNNTVVDNDNFHYVVLEENEQQNQVKAGDLLFLMSSEDYESIAKSAVVLGDPGEVYLNSFCRGLRITNHNCYAPFLNYQLNSEMYRDALRFEARGFTRINIKIDRVASHFVSLPPFSEQQTIADYLDEKCAKIDAAIANIDKQTDALKRLKRSLINEVITGQRAV